MEQKFVKLNLHQNKVNDFPKKVIIIHNNNKEEKTLHSQEDMDSLLEEVKLFNLDNDNKKRIISI